MSLFFPENPKNCLNQTFSRVLKWDDAYKRPCDFGREYFAIYLKFVLQTKLCVYHLGSLRNLSLSADKAEKSGLSHFGDPPGAPYTLNFCRKI